MNKEATIKERLTNIEVRMKYLERLMWVVTTIVGGQFGLEQFIL